MKKHLQLLISIPKPCQEDWNSMTPNEKGRFCESCQKTVIDFSQMSDAELLHFLQNQQGKICGNIPKHRLDTPILIPQPAIPISRWATAGLVAAGLLTVVPVIGQQNAPQQKEIIQQNQNGSLENADPVIIQGTVRDQADQSPLIGVIISLEHTDLQTTTDSSGYFSFELPPTHRKTEQRFLIEYSGYTPIIQLVNLQAQPIVVDAFLQVLEFTLPDVCVVDYAKPMVKGLLTMTGGVFVVVNNEEETVWKKLKGWWKKNKIKRSERQAKRKSKENHTQPIAEQAVKAEKTDAVEHSTVTPRQNSFQAQAFPNPFDQELQVAFQSDKDQQVVYTVLNMQGKQVTTGQLAVSKGEQRNLIALTNELAAGTYIVSFKNKLGEQVSLQVVKATP